MPAQQVAGPLRMSEVEFLARYADLKPSYEFVNGDVTQKPMTKRAHRRVAEELIGRLWLYRSPVLGEDLGVRNRRLI